MKLAPAFRRSHSLAAPPFCDLRKAMGSSRLTISVPLFDLKFPKRTRRLGCGDFRPAVLALLRALTALLLVMAASISPGRAQTTLDKVSFGTNWVAEAEHGGFFQAVVDGTYEKYGLDVTIVPGGPNENNRMLLVARRLDFFMAANTLMSFDAVANNVPVVTVAAIFQKDPQVLLTHPESKVTKLEELKPLTLFVSKEGMSSYFQWLRSEERL